MAIACKRAANRYLALQHESASGAVTSVSFAEMLASLHYAGETKANRGRT
jgi:hypothetical protein